MPQKKGEKYSESIIWTNHFLLDATYSGSVYLLYPFKTYKAYFR